DGWAKDYGHEARAQLKRARWSADRFEVDSVGSSPEEFTFFDVFPLDARGDGVRSIAARGNLQVDLFDPTGPEKWERRLITTVGQVSAIAIGRDGGGRRVVYIPNDAETRVVPFP